MNIETGTSQGNSESKRFDEAVEMVEEGHRGLRSSTSTTEVPRFPINQIDVVERLIHLDGACASRVRALRSNRVKHG